MTTPHPFLTHLERLPKDRPDYAAIKSAHDAAVAADEAIYRDPTTGLMVFTAVALAQRGWCCERGCRHCPYPTQQGPLPQTT